MKKVKKIFAIIMSLAMIMGLGMTTMAAQKDTATIKITDENGTALTIYDEYTNKNGVKLEYAQIIVPDQKTETGWAFVGNTSQDTVKDLTITDVFLQCFSVGNDQDAITELINTTTDSNNIATSNTEEIANAYSALKDTLSYTPVNANPFNVQTAGVYLIKASQSGYTYNMMAAYVGFGKVEIDGTTYDYPSLKDVNITAKRSPESVTKKTQDSDNVVAVGDILTYTIEAYVPFFDVNDVNKTFQIVDEVKGANYYLSGEGSTATVVMGTDKTEVADVNDFIVSGKTFTIDLSNLIDKSNTNAGKLITVTYTVKVDGTLNATDNDGVEVENKASTHIGDKVVDSDPVKVYTGTIILTKRDSEDSSKLLTGAGFEVRVDSETDPLKFEKISDGLYQYNPAGTVTEVFTGDKGTLKLVGLNVGTYKFKETTAPDGYHIANTEGGVDVSAEISVDQGKKATEVIVKPISMTNTKLSSLPSTGGIGTTIFTIGGIVIMIAAAALFFANRRKNNAQ